jgi:hypothetical protein
MRKILVPVLAVLLVGTVALVIYRFALTERLNSSRETQGPRALAFSLPPSGPGALQEPHAKAWKSLQGGHLRDAQDAYLEILSLNPQDQDAQHGLVVVRRRMAGDNAEILRRQAAGYWDAIKQGVETEEHYSPGAMEALLAATLQAVQEIEGHKKPTTRDLGESIEAMTAAAAPPGGKLPPPATRSAKPVGPQTPLLSGGKLPPPVTPSAKPTGPQKPLLSATPALRAAEKPPATRAKQIPPSPAASAPQGPPPPAASASPPLSTSAHRVSPPADSGPQTSPQTAASAATWGLNPRTSPPPAASAPQITPPPPDPSRLYMVRVGPVSDRDRAAALEKQLVAGGFSQTNVTSRTGFRVVSEPLPRSVAEGMIATLAGRGFHSQIEPLAGDTVQLIFGTFSSQKEAETLSQRIVAAGYDAWVREGTVYTLQLGPYPQSSMNAITGIIKSGAPGAAVTTDPAP